MTNCRITHSLTYLITLISGTGAGPLGTGERRDGENGFGATPERDAVPLLVQFRPGGAAAEARDRHVAPRIIASRNRAGGSLLVPATGTSDVAAVDLRAGEQDTPRETTAGREAIVSGARGVRKAEKEAHQSGGRVRVDARQKHRRRGPEHRGGAKRAQRGDQRAAGAQPPLEANRTDPRL